MGRVRRYKRIKAIDPFSKTGGVVDPDAGKVVNKAPTRKELTGDAVPRSVQLMLERRAAAGLGGTAPRKPFKPAPKTLPDKAFAHVSALPGESLASFNRRVDAERGKQLSAQRQQVLESRPVSAKRKAYQKKLAERRRMRGTGTFDEETRAERWEVEQETKWAAREAARRQGPVRGAAAEVAPSAAGHKRPRSEPEAGQEEVGPSAAPSAPAARRTPVLDFPTEHVTFGDRVMEPPKLTVVPRKSQVRKGMGGWGGIVLFPACSSRAALSATLHN